MDADIEAKRTGKRRASKRLILIPDADVSEPELDSDQDEDFQPEPGDFSDTNTSDSEDELPLATLNRRAADPDPNLDSDDELFLADLLDDPTSDYRWRKKDVPTRPLEFQLTFQMPQQIQPPITYFRQFYTDDLFDLIVRESLNYAAQKNANLLLERDEFEQFCGILLKMGLIPMPRYKMYWNEEMRFPPIADVMTRDRFEAILRYLHFNNNAHLVTQRENPLYDRCFKIRPLLDLLQRNCLRLEPEEKQCIDEQIVPFKGKNKLRVYIPKKPKKWGFKIYARCGVSGLVYDFFMYDGSPVTIEDSSGFQPGDVVLKLCENLPENANFKLYFDNFFTFPEVQLMLMKKCIWTVGTIRCNRLRNCPLKSEKELKRSGRGSFDLKTDLNSGLCVVRWFDNSAVQLSSTFVGAEPVQSSRRWDRRLGRYIEIPCPAIVKSYNEHMGGVDKFDMFAALYRIDHKSRKWYRRIFYWTLSLAAINGWLLYRRECGQLQVPERERLDLLDFVTRISNSLIKGEKVVNVQRKRGRPRKRSSTDSEEEAPAARGPRRGAVQATPASEIRYDGIGHFPAHREPKRRCRLCNSLVRMSCMKCEVYLCVTKNKNCFLTYHTGS